MKKIITILFLINFFLSLAFAQEGGIIELPPEPQPLRAASSFDGGRLYETEGLCVVELWGSYRRIGMQYGRLLKKELADFYQLAVEKGLMGRMGCSEASLHVRARTNFELYPLWLKEVVHGMAQGSGLSLDKILILNQLISIVMTESDVYTSVLAVKSAAAKDGALICGASFDYPSWFSDLIPYVTIAVFNPSDCVHSVALLGFPGGLEVLNAFNETGLMFFAADASLSAGKSYIYGRSCVLTLLSEYLFDYSTLDQLDAAIVSTRPDYPVIVTAADKKEVHSYECSTFDVVQRGLQDEDLLSAVNCFLDPSWKLGAPRNDPGLSPARQNNLLFLAQKHRGGFLLADMKNIFSRTVSQGGVIFSGTASYQVAAVAKDLCLFLKTHETGNWVEVKLPDFFGLTKEVMLDHKAALPEIEEKEKTDEQATQFSEVKSGAVNDRRPVGGQEGEVVEKAQELSLDEIIYAASQKKGQGLSTETEEDAPKDQEEEVLTW